MKRYILILLFAISVFKVSANNLSPTDGSAWPEQTLTESQNVYVQGFAIAIGGTITIPSGITLGIYVDPSNPNTITYLTDVREPADGSGRTPIFNIQAGGKLIIHGTSTCEFRVEGNGPQWFDTPEIDGLVFSKTIPEYQQEKKEGKRDRVYYYKVSPIICYGEIDMKYASVMGMNVNITPTDDVIYNISNYGTIFINCSDQSKTCRFDNVRFDHNTASGGAAINFGTAGCSVEITNCHFTKNEAHNHATTPTFTHIGGVIRSHGECNSRIKISGCLFDYNHSYDNGGAIYWSGYQANAMMTISGSTFLNNYASLSGGAILLEGKAEFTDGNEFMNNKADRNGGAISIEGYSGNDTSGAATTIGFNLNSGLNIHDNISPSGAGVGVNLRPSVSYPIGSTVNINIAANIHDNKANYNSNMADAPIAGGGVFITNDMKPEYNYTVNVNLNGGSIKDNIAGTGGGIHVLRANVNILNDIDISGNKSNVSFSPSVSVASEPEFWNYGGAVLVEGGTVNLNGGTISSNQALVNGGGVAVKNSSVTTESSTVDFPGSVILDGAKVISNTAQKGGAIFIKDGSFTATSGTVGESGKANTSMYGAGIYIAGNGSFSATSDNASIQYNNSSVDGGGVFIESGSVLMNGGKIINNTSSGNGGGIYITNGNIVNNGGYISNNSSCNGAGLFVSTGDITISDGRITNNTATVNGGAVYAAGGNVTITGGEISNNKALISGMEGGYGGAFYISSSDNTKRIRINQGLIQGNTAQKSGGAFCITNGIVEITYGTVNENIASENGGGIYATGGEFYFNKDGEHSGSIIGNTARNGGGLFINGGSSTLTGGTLSENIATNNGGGVYLSAGHLSISGGDVTRNNAYQNGGGVYANGGQLDFTGGAGGTVGYVNHNSAMNGGGIYLSNGAVMNIQESKISDNKALSKSGTVLPTTGYHGVAGSGETLQGLGGGIFLDKGLDGEHKTTLNFSSASKLGIYNNIGEVGADEIFSCGDNTVIYIPAVTDMDISGFSGKANGWYEDYLTGDTAYSNSSLTDVVRTLGKEAVRYRTVSSITGVPAEYVADISKAETRYLSITVGVQYAKLVIKKTGLMKDESAIFTLTNGDSKRIVVLTGISDDGREVSATLTKLDSGEWTVKEESSWSWTYNDIPSQKVTMTKSDNKELTFTNDKKEDLPSNDEKMKENIFINAVGIQVNINNRNEENGGNIGL